MDLPTDPRERALALLEAHHAFPGPFEFRVVVRPDAREAALAAVVASVGSGDRVDAVSERQSSNGNYVSLRVQVALDRATQVLEVYETLRAVHGVVTVL